MPPEKIPEESQKALLRAKLRPGSIFCIYCDFLPIPHYKFVVIAYVDYDDEVLLVFFINSKIANFIEQNPSLRACQIRLAKTPNYSFLEYDSFLDCSQVIDEIEVNEAINHLLKDPSDYKGHLAEAEILDVLQVVNSADTIPDFDKELIINSLGE
jgi:hypothetical protein